MRNQPSLAALSSGHPTEPGNPRFQRNNTMNTAGLRPQEIEYRTPYNDGTVRYPISGVQYVNALATPPRSQFPLTPDQEEAADFLRGTTTLPMAETERRGPGDRMAGTSNGINPEMFMAPRGPRGMNTAPGKRGPQLRA